MAIVDVIDSIKITEESDITKVLAEWSELDPDITTYVKMTSGYAVKLFINWSDKAGTVALHEGDYFTFDVPAIFKQGSVGIVTDALIKTPTGEVAATYSIYDNGGGNKQVKITFSDYVETHVDISGEFWMLLYVASVETTETKTIEFVINDELAASGTTTVDPIITDNDPHNEKYGHSAVADIYDGYYIFNWNVRLNMSEDPVSGFNVLNDFSFQDIIPENSPHVFLTDEIRQRLNLRPTDYPLRIGEYNGADSYPAGERYALFRSHYNSYNVNLWTNHIDYFPLVNGYTRDGIDGGNGIEVSNLVLSEKILSANLGKLTRPTSIQYCTYATVKIAESALGDEKVVELFTNTFKANYGEDMTVHLDIHRFGSGGTAQGISGDYSFMFNKVDENDVPLAGAMFSLLTSENYESGGTAADRIVYSGNNGVVAFNNIPEGIYYFWETEVPLGYILDGTVYKVVLNRDGYTIYYGTDFTNVLSGNKIVNRRKSTPEPIPVQLFATKNLTGRTLASGMFYFVVRDGLGKTVATGTNDAAGNIAFSEIVYDTTGEYYYTVSEVAGTFAGITYDTAIFNVTVTITEDEGVLSADITYPTETVVFSNSYAQPPKKPCVCPSRITKCRKTIAGQKIWIDNNNAENTRPESVEIILLRDGDYYMSQTLETATDAEFVFCCVPIRDNQGRDYDYQLSEKAVQGYSSTVEGNNIINTLI